MESEELALLDWLRAAQGGEEEEEKEVEEPSKRPRIAFEDRRLRNLDLKRGRLGPA